MNARLISIGTAVPRYAITQEDSALMAGQISRATAEHSRVVTTLYRRASIQHRGSVLLENGRADGRLGQTFFPCASNDDDRGPGTDARSRRYMEEAPALAVSASARALAAAGLQAGQVTHLVTVSCTGFAAPGVDAALIDALALTRSVERTHVGFMGCHGAINGLRVARAFAHGDPEARVLVCAVELCSLHFHYAPDPEKVVANAIFADGAAAAVIAGGGGGPPSRQLSDVGSFLVPGSAEAMTWRIGDHGFEMTLSARVPSLISSHLRNWLVAWLATKGLALDDVESWAVHPGGPRVLSTVGACLELPPEALIESRRVLAEHGNMSSPTILFILERVLRCSKGGPCVAMAFGPGLCIEAALLR